MATVELRDFTWRHAGRKRPAVREVSLEIPHGQRVLLLGPSGAGKSTLLHAMAGLLPADSGEQSGAVLLDDTDARNNRHLAAMVFQDPQTQLVMARAGDDVAFGLENRGVPATEIWPRVDEALRAVGFQYELQRQTTALSGGEQQRLALAGALAVAPGLLLLDEPTANLDPEGAQAIRQALRHMLSARDTTAVMVEHHVSESLDLIDRVVALADDGTVLADGEPAAVFDRYRDTLTAAGAWVPGAPPVPPRRATSVGETLLNAEAVSLRYPDTSDPALRDVNLALRRGEITAVRGRNGSGKSSLAMVAGGLVRPTTGTIHITGGPHRPPHRWRAPVLARHIGSVFQSPEQQFVTARVSDELALGPRAARMPEAEITSVVDDLLERLRLTHLAEANPFTLSGGEARRLSVATALSCAADILILDEPTFGQDRRTWTELIDLLARLRDNGHTILTVTHDNAAVAAVADRRLSLREGRTC